MAGAVKQINVKARTPGERGLPKGSVDSAFVGRGGLVGDFNVYRHEEIEDDPDSAVLIMPVETIEELNSEGWPVKPGDLGENLTTSGIPYSSFSVGKTFTAGKVGSRFQGPATPATTCSSFPTCRV